MTLWSDRWEARLAELTAIDRRRQRRVHTPDSPLSFCDNDYLGLAQHPALSNLWYQVASSIPVGSGASALVSGHHPSHRQLEDRLARWVGRDRAVLFSSGYAANLGLAQALLEPGVSVLHDRLNHASLVDGSRLMGARMHRYAHADATACAARLEGLAEPTVVLTDSVFSMDGTVAPLAELATCCAEAGALLVVDEAHGLGVLGPEGEGLVGALGLTQAEVPVVMGTLGKALGCQGAFVAGPSALIDLLENAARTLIYSTAESPRMAAVTLGALDLLQAHPEWRSELRRNVQLFREEASRLGVPLTASDTPIQPVIVGSDARALALSAALWADGYWVSAIRPPTVPEGSARLRITLSRRHQPEQISALVQSLAHHYRILYT